MNIFFQSKLDTRTNNFLKNGTNEDAYTAK